MITSIGLRCRLPVVLWVGCFIWCAQQRVQAVEPPVHEEIVTNSCDETIKPGSLVENVVAIFGEPLWSQDMGGGKKMLLWPPRGGLTNGNPITVYAATTESGVVVSCSTMAVYNLQNVPRGAAASPPPVLKAGVSNGWDGTFKPGSSLQDVISMLGEPVVLQTESEERSQLAYVTPHFDTNGDRIFAYDVMTQSGVVVGCSPMIMYGWREAVQWQEESRRMTDTPSTNISLEFRLAGYMDETAGATNGWDVFELCGRQILVQGKPEMTIDGGDIASARCSTQRLDIVLTSRAAEEWRIVTARSVFKRLAIFSHGRLVAAPEVRCSIEDGEVCIEKQTDCEW